MRAVQKVEETKYPATDGTGALPGPNAVRRLVAGRGRVSLTFDDGPDPGFTPQLLDILAEACVPATFFVIADQALKHPGIVCRMIREGHSVGSHGWTHRHPWLLSSTSARDQVVLANRALASLLGRTPRWYRPPHGAIRSSARQAAFQAGQHVVLWSRSAIDWGPLATTRGVTQRLCAVQDGDIVLMHDGRNRFNRPEVILEVLPMWLQRLSEKKLRPVLLPERY